ncbi:hypothetical protein V6N13_001849 [Hibiscus sabdariffa]
MLKKMMLEMLKQIMLRDVYANDVGDASTCKFREKFRSLLMILEEKMNMMRDEMAYALQKISRRIKDDGADIDKLVAVQASRKSLRLSKGYNSVA